MPGRWLIVVASLSLVAAQRASVAPPAIVREIEQELAAARVPGAAIAVVSGDEVLASGYGIADLDPAMPMTASTLMQAGSLTKMFTALAASATLTARQMSFDMPIGRVMTGLAHETAAMTFDQLLAQTSGLRDRAGDTGADDEAALAASARALGAPDLILPRGVVFSYSNPGYALAGAALEALARQPFADLLREAVLTPLGMARSTMRPADVVKHPHAVGHRLEGATAIAQRTPANDTRLWPAGYLWTTATDMARALSAWVSDGRVQGAPGLPAPIMAALTRPRTPMPNVFVGGHYGYGLMIARDRGLLVYEHGGTMPGFSALVRIVPERRLGIAILTNLENAPLRRIAQTAMSKALALPATEPTTRQETPVTVEEITPFLGRYQNRGTADLTVRDGRVALSLDDGPPLGVTRIGEHRYLARPKPGVAGPEFVLHPATDRAPAYLHFALWAYTRR